jgi:hypothetical protein
MKKMGNLLTDLATLGKRAARSPRTAASLLAFATLVGITAWAGAQSSAPILLPLRHRNARGHANRPELISCVAPGHIAPRTIYFSTTSTFAWMVRVGNKDNWQIIHPTTDWQQYFVDVVKE